MRLMPSSPPPARQDPAGLGEIAPELLGGLRSEVLAWFAAAGRDLPWRHTRDPYRILVAEMLAQQRSEEHTSELQSRVDLVCRLLLETKKQMRWCRLQRTHKQRILTAYLGPSD